MKMTGTRERLAVSPLEELKSRLGPPFRIQPGHVLSARTMWRLASFCGCMCTITTRVRTPLMCAKRRSSTCFPRIFRLRYLCSSAVFVFKPSATPTMRIEKISAILKEFCAIGAMRGVRAIKLYRVRLAQMCR